MVRKQLFGDNFYYLRCIKCKKVYDERKNTSKCIQCNTPLEVIYDYDSIKSRLNFYDLKHSPISALKYLRFYPIRNFERIVSLNEGGTPLVHSKNLAGKLNIKNLYIKNETVNPTGGFKDRGSLVEITKALEIGATNVCVASAGNMAASVSAYCAVAKLPCYVLIPEGTPIGRLSQSLSFGARVLQVRGTYNDCASLAEKMAKNYGYYLAGDYVFRVEGQKSQAYEIIEQLYWQVPDYIICPIGCGTNIAAIWRGFLDFKRLGLIEKMPKLVGVQASGCNPITKAFKKGLRTFVPIQKPDTICTSVAAGDPLDGLKALHAIYDSKGTVLDIDDNEALEYQHLIAEEESIYIEPASALAVSAIDKLNKNKFFKKDDTIVCIATASGLKDPLAALKIMPDPPSIEPDIREIDKYLKNKIYEISATKILEKTQKIWLKTPNHKKLRIFINKEFNVTLADQLIDRVHKICRSFEKKGKYLTKSDLQNIIEEILNEFSLQERVLRIRDFDVNDSIHKKSKACVDMEYKNKKYTGVCAEGDGIFDAIINAVQKTLGKEYLEIILDDYKVVIATGGTGAVVKVSITLRDQKNNKVVATSTSPDVIVASVYAFEKGYNILYWKNQ